MNVMAAVKPVQGRAPPRPVPEDFEIVFVEQGRVECEAWYRARRTTITRWLEECGKDRLIAKRAAYVKHLRKEGRWLTRASDMVEHRDITKPLGPPRERIRVGRFVSPALVRRAARYLQSVRNGGWAIAPQSDGTWLVGTKRRSPAEVVEMAVRKGFDRNRAAQEITAEGERP